MSSNWIAAVKVETGEAVMLWDGAGRIANDEGDIWGNSPRRVTRWGKLVIDRDRADAAIMMAWRVVDKAWPDVGAGEIAGSEACDPAFIWIERTEAERDALCS